MIKFIKENWIGILFWILVIGSVSGVFFGNTEKPEKTNYGSDFKYNYPSYVNSEYTKQHDEEVEEYKEKPDGIYIVEACSQDSGSCYDLDADISDGVVERIYFLNGGHLDLDGAELDENGFTSGESFTVSEGYNDDTWDINCYDCE